MIEGISYSLADVIEPERPNLVRIDDAGVHLMVYPAGNSYDIETSRIDNQEKLLRWIRHLSGKIWFTNSLLKELFDKVNEHFGLEIQPGVPA